MLGAYLNIFEQRIVFWFFVGVALPTGRNKGKTQYCTPETRVYQEFTKSKHMSASEKLLVFIKAKKEGEIAN